MAVKKKLIEVALPLEAINAESTREKSIRHGHPSTLHLWWARRPLATARAVIWSSLVDDPSSHPEQFPTEEAQQRERERLFGILTRLVKWENSNDEAILAEAKAEIMKSTGTVKYYAQIRLQVWQNEVCTGAELPALDYPIAEGRVNVKGGVAACEALDASSGFCYQPATSSCTSRCFMLMYFLPPHWVPAT